MCGRIAPCNSPFEPLDRSQSARIATMIIDHDHRQHLHKTKLPTPRGQHPEYSPAATYQLRHLSSAASSLRIIQSLSRYPWEQHQEHAPTRCSTSAAASFIPCNRCSSPSRATPRAIKSNMIANIPEPASSSSRRRIHSGDTSDVNTSPGKRTFDTLKRNTKRSKSNIATFTIQEISLPEHHQSLGDTSVINTLRQATVLLTPSEGTPRGARVTLLRTQYKRSHHQRITTRDTPQLCHLHQPRSLDITREITKRRPHSSRYLYQSIALLATQGINISKLRQTTSSKSCFESTQ